ncbi:efflux RND transporter periplasmic adaptor subunit [Rhodocyclaceae bacterium SMB388]
MRPLSLSLSLVLLLSLLVLLAGCGERPEQTDQAAAPPYVMTARLVAAAAGDLGLSGTVRARVEVPLAFQVRGRITARYVDAGQLVQARQLLFELDASDLEQGVRTAEADFAAAELALATTQADLARDRRLHDQARISTQAFERGELAFREMRSRRDAAAARLQQARNALGYARLTSPAAGVLIEVGAEPGQVMDIGEPVALLAQDGAREIEVYFPEGVTPPPRGELLRPDGTTLPLELRETAGAVEALSRTQRARYTVADDGGALVLGAVVRARFASQAMPTHAFVVPIGALAERGQGAQVWRVEQGRVVPVAVTVLGLDDRTARITGPLALNETVVALGTHLLREGMAVRELPR